MTTAIDDSIQVLLDHPGAGAMIVSCYADTSPQTGFESFWSQHLKHEAAAIEARLGDDVSAREALAENVAVIRHALADPDAARQRGLALFSAAERGFFLQVPLGVPVKDRLVVDEEPYLVPLLEATHRQRRYLLAVTDSHHGRILAAAWGQTRLLKEIEHDIPRRQKSSGETWGKEQATIARHREDLLLHYRKALAQAVEKAWADGSYRGLILLGEPETLQAVHELLPVAIAQQIVHTARLQWGQRAVDLNARAQEVLETAMREHDARLVEELERRLRENYLVAAGPQEVLNALRQGQVGYPGYLVLEPDRGDMAARCTRCDSVFTTMPATCPYCHGTCEKVNLWQEILLFAARHAITAHTVEHNDELSRHGGVAAVLSRAEPWSNIANG